MTIASDSGQSEALSMITHARKLLQSPRPERDELKKALQVLLENHKGSVAALEHAALLAPLARNRKAWSYVSKGRGKRMRPFLGYIAYHRFLQDNPSDDEKAEWFFLIENSAELGFLPARFYVMEKKAPRKGIARTVLLKAFRLYLFAIGASIALRNPKDGRLPIKKDTGKSTWDSLPEDE